MQLQNAIKKIEKAGYTAEHISGERNCLYQVKMTDQGRVLEFYAGPEADSRVHCIGVRSANDMSDPMTDYCAFVFYDNITQAIRK